MIELELVVGNTWTDRVTGLLGQESFALTWPRAEGLITGSVGDEAVRVARSSNRAAREISLEFSHAGEIGARSVSGDFWALQGSHAAGRVVVEGTVYDADLGRSRPLSRRHQLRLGEVRVLEIDIARTGGTCTASGEVDDRKSALAAILATRELLLLARRSDGSF